MALIVVALLLCLLASVVVANDGAVQPDAGVCDTRLVDLQRAHDSLQQQLAALQARYDELAASKPTPRPARGVDPASADSKDLRDNIDEMIVSERDRLVCVCARVCVVAPRGGVTWRGVAALVWLCGPATCSLVSSFE
jgi:hypothetical protein